MKTLFFIYTSDTIQNAVKLETSLLAERRRTQAGEEMLYDLVMDERYQLTLKKYISDAHAEIILNLNPSFIADTPTDLDIIYYEFPDFRIENDFNLWINLHDDHPDNYNKSIDIKIMSFIVDYVCYRWLETKSQADALIYFGRTERALYDIKRLLVRKTIPLKRFPSFP